MKEKKKYHLNVLMKNRASVCEGERLSFHSLGFVDRCQAEMGNKTI